MNAKMTEGTFITRSDQLLMIDKDTTFSFLMEEKSLLAQCTLRLIFW